MACCRDGRANDCSCPLANGFEELPTLAMSLESDLALKFTGCMLGHDAEIYKGGAQEPQKGLLAVCVGSAANIAEVCEQPLTSDGLILQ